MFCALDVVFSLPLCFVHLFASFFYGIHTMNLLFEDTCRVHFIVVATFFLFVVFYYNWRLI